MSNDSALKMVSYRDAVTFAIPIGWTFEDEPGIQGTYYEDAPNSGTLRVSVMQWRGENEEDRNQILKSMLSGSVEQLKQGIYLTQEIAAGHEDGEDLALHRWVVALALPDNVCRVAVFTHTVVKGTEKEPQIAQELAAVDFAVRNAVFSYKTDLPLLDTP